MNLTRSSSSSVTSTASVPSSPSSSPYSVIHTPVPSHSVQLTDSSIISDVSQLSDEELGIEFLKLYCRNRLIQLENEAYNFYIEKNKEYFSLLPQPPPVRDPRKFSGTGAMLHNRRSWTPILQEGMLGSKKPHFSPRTSTPTSVSSRQKRYHNQRKMITSRSRFFLTKVQKCIVLKSVKKHCKNTWQINCVNHVKETKKLSGLIILNRKKEKITKNEVNRTENMINKEIGRDIPFTRREVRGKEQLIKPLLGKLYLDVGRKRLKYKQQLEERLAVRFRILKRKCKSLNLVLFSRIEHQEYYGDELEFLGVGREYLITQKQSATRALQLACVDEDCMKYDLLGGMEIISTLSKELEEVECNNKKVLIRIQDLKKEIIRVSNEILTVKKRSEEKLKSRETGKYISQGPSPAEYMKLLDQLGIYDKIAKNLNRKCGLYKLKNCTVT